MPSCPLNSPLPLLTAAAFCACLAAVSPSHATDTYSVTGTNIMKNGKMWIGTGCDDFEQTGLTTVTGYGFQIVRIPIDDMTECPIYTSQGTLHTSLGYEHPLQDVVSNNRSQGLITILTPFGWDLGSNQQILNNFPSQMSYYAAFKTKLAAIAAAFAGQTDVWIEVWNEPYPWTNTGFTESQWLSDMNDLYNTIRGQCSNIILIPGQAEDTQETVLVDKGSTFLSGKTNVVADIHCYNGWTGNSEANSISRIQNIRNAGWALIFAEAGQDQYVTNCTNLLNAAVSQGVPTLGWSWNANDGSQLVSNGTPTAWGNQFLPYLASTAPTNLPLFSTKYETENATVVNYVTASGGGWVLMTGDSNLSNEEGTALYSNNVSDYITFVVPNISAGTYDVKVGIKKNTSRGQFQLQVGKASDFSGTATNVGPVVDEYASSVVYASVDLGNWAPGSTSDKWFRFNVVGKNSASSGTYAYELAFDYILLTPQ
jgi:mannan endo-1,4-beta-mannosidase